MLRKSLDQVCASVGGTGKCSCWGGETARLCGMIHDQFRNEPDLAKIHRMWEQELLDYHESVRFIEEYQREMGWIP